jgi:hypothetical protein
VDVKHQLSPIEISPRRAPDEHPTSSHLDSAAHRLALKDALRGVELPERDRTAIEHLANQDTPTVAAIVSLLLRAWQCGYDQAVAAQNPFE